MGIGTKRQMKAENNVVEGEMNGVKTFATKLVFEKIGISE